MSEKESIKFSVAEIAAALMKERGIHRGRWMLVFGFSRANVFTGPSEEEVRQTVAISISGARLMEVKPDTKFPDHLVYDAEIVNPIAKSSKSTARTPRSRPKPKETIAD